MDCVHSNEDGRVVNVLHWLVTYWQVGHSLVIWQTAASAEATSYFKDFVSIHWKSHIAASHRRCVSGGASALLFTVLRCCINHAARPTTDINTHTQTDTRTHSACAPSSAAVNEMLRGCTTFCEPNWQRDWQRCRLTTYWILQLHVKNIRALFRQFTFRRSVELKPSRQRKIWASVRRLGPTQSSVFRAFISEILVLHPVQLPIYNINYTCNWKSHAFNPLVGTCPQRGTAIQQCGDRYTGRWWM